MNKDLIILIDESLHEFSGRSHVIVVVLPWSLISSPAGPFSMTTSFGSSRTTVPQTLGGSSAVAAKVSLRAAKARITIVTRTITRESRTRPALVLSRLLSVLRIPQLPNLSPARSPAGNDTVRVTDERVFNITPLA